MAACQKCGRRKVRKNRIYGYRKCPRCGVLGGDARLDRSGVPTNSDSPAFVCEQSQEIEHELRVRTAREGGKLRVVWTSNG